jgi:hypothetical protein
MKFDITLAAFLQRRLKRSQKFHSHIELTICSTLLYIFLLRAA